MGTDRLSIVNIAFIHKHSILRARKNLGEIGKEAGRGAAGMRTGMDWTEKNLPYVGITEVDNDGDVINSV